MLEKLEMEEYKSIAIPSKDVLVELDKLIEENTEKVLSICEVGVGIGATAQAIIKK